MSAQALPSLPVSPAPPPGHALRVEYLDFQDVDGHREFRFHVYGPDGSGEFRMRIANAAFDARRVRMQDGPDLCYQKLLREIAAGVTARDDVSTIDDADLVRYRDDHTAVAKRRAISPATAAVEPRTTPSRSSRRGSASSMRCSEWA
jgi:hypothetical protein